MDLNFLNYIFFLYRTNHLNDEYYGIIVNFYIKLYFMI